MIERGMDPSVMSDTAVQAMREGAADYVFKSQMSGAVVSRSVRYAIERGARCRAEKMLAAGSIILASPVYFSDVTP